MRKEIIGILICMLFIISALTTSAVPIKTTTVFSENDDNQKNIKSKEVLEYILDFGFFKAEAMIDVTYKYGLGNYFGCSHVKNVFFVGYGITLYDDNTSKEGFIIRNIQEPGYMGAVIFKDISPNEEYIRFGYFAWLFFVVTKVT